MFFEPPHNSPSGDPAQLILEDLLAIKSAHIRGKLGRGRRGPDGERPGRGRAHSLDFDGLAPYVLGDDVRWIDWRASLRSGETMSRRYAAASHRAQMLILDLSPELHFGSQGRVMAKTAALTTAWLAWNALALNEPVGLMAGATRLRPARGRRHVLRLLDAVVTAFDRSRTGGHVSPDFQAASAMIGQHDEISMIAELPVPADPLVQVGRSLSGTRILRFYLIEDPMMRRALPPGRYPVRAPDGARQVPHLSGGQPPRHAAERALGDAGWEIERALDLLPRGAA